MKEIVSFSVYAAVTSATLNFEKFSERFVTKEEANYYKMLLYILCGLVGFIYIMILCKLLVYLYKSLGVPVWKKMKALLPKKKVKSKEVNDTELLRDQKKDEILSDMSDTRTQDDMLSELESISDNELVSDEGRTPVRQETGRAF